MAEIRQGEFEAAQLAVAAAESHYTASEFEFNQAFVTSPIDGIVASVDVQAGERRQIGTSFGGVIVLDPRLLNCRCLMTPDELVRLESMRSSIAASSANDETDGGKARKAEQLRATVGMGEKKWEAKLISIGVLADAQTGRIPVILEVQNPDETLRAGMRVPVRLGEQRVSDSKD